jgi:[protein-PII] uridylyltransferase
VSARAELDAARARARASLLAGEGGVAVTRSLAEFVGEQVAGACPSEPGLAIIAQGGLGRMEQLPFADVDLLVVMQNASLEPAVQAMLTALWDTGLHLGYAVTTSAQALERASADHHAATALLEGRVLAGDAALGERVLEAHAAALHRGREEFTERKLEELRARRRRFGDAVYLVEPNVKSSPGGLRDIHSLLWIGRALSGRHDEHTLASLHAHGVINDQELTSLKRGLDELLALRAALQLVAQRAEDRLLFMHQEAVADALAIKADRELQPMDVLMRGYFEVAAAVRRSVDDAVERLTIEPSAATMTRAVDGGLCARGPYLFPEDPDWFDGGVARVVDAYRVAAEHGLALSPRARQRVYRAVSAPDWDDPGVGRALLRLCRCEEGSGQPFTALLESGGLAAALRDIHRLKGRFKHDGYHAYTADAHIARVSDLAWRAIVGEELVPAPLQAAFARMSRPHLLVLAALFHDIGKGIEGDHSKTGADIADREAQRMGLPDDEREILRFLVEEHLALSRASQRRDLSDPEVVTELAEQCGTVERLDLLALLTWVDIAGVAPGMFTDWKARLLGLAVQRVRAFLLDPETGGAIRGQRESVARKRALTLLTPVVGEEVAQRFVAGASTRTLTRRMSGALVEDAKAFAKYTGDPIIEPRLAAGGYAHHVRVVAADRHGLLADIAGAFADAGANLLHAHAGSRDDAVAVDSFRIDDGEGNALEDDALQRLVAGLERAARDGVDRVPSRPRSPPPGTKTYVRFLDEVDSEGALVIEVRTADRPGLVADIARQIADAGYSIVLAKLDTEGHAARDSFYVVEGERASRPALEAGVTEAAEGAR